MFALILSLLLVAQDATRLPADAGTITGVIKTASGTPAAGVRVTAQARPESPGDVLSSASFASLAETDQSGRYRLENIPPGDYFVGAGRMGSQTFYPGTEEMLKGKAITVKASTLISNIDFALDDSSIRLPDNDVTPILGAITGLTVPVQVRMEGGAKQPLVSDNRIVTFRLTRLSDQSRFDMPLTDAIQNFSISDPLPGNEYRVSVENLPKGYAVKSLMQDGMDLRTGTFKLTAKSFAPAPVSLRDLTAPGAYKDSVQFKSNAGMPMTPIEITLASTAVSSERTGTRVTGRASSPGVWYPTIFQDTLPGSVVPGTFFADGSFDFGVIDRPGRYSIFLQDKPTSPSRVLAARLDVGGTGELDNILAEEIPVLPLEFLSSRSVQTGGQPSPGQIPLASLRGSLVDDSSKAPVLGGHVTLTGDSGKVKVEFPIDSLGLFAIPRLFPGLYELTINGYQHESVGQRVTIGEKDVELNIAAKPSN